MFNNKAAQAILSVVGSGPLFAIIYSGNQQYKVSVGDVVAVQRYHIEIGSEIAFKKVLVLGGPRFTAIGRPFLSHCRVVGTVEEQKLMKNVITVSQPKGMRRTFWLDYQHPATIVRITAVKYDPQVVGEVSKETGMVQDPKEFEWDKSVNHTYWDHQLPAHRGNAFAPPA